MSWTKILLRDASWIFVLFYEKTLLIDNIDSKDVIPNVSLLRRFTNIGLWKKDLNRICPSFHCTGEDIDVPEN